MGVRGKIVADEGYFPQRLLVVHFAGAAIKLEQRIIEVGCDFWAFTTDDYLNCLRIGAPVKLGQVFGQRSQQDGQNLRRVVFNVDYQTEGIVPVGARFVVILLE